MTGLLTTEAAARELGISPGHLRRRLDIPRVMVGRRGYRYDPADLEAFKQRNKRAAVLPIEVAPQRRQPLSGDWLPHDEAVRELLGTASDRRGRQRRATP